MNIPAYCQEDLIRLRQLIALLTVEQYRQPCEWLSQATIGQHIRHILSFYDCVLRQMPKGCICYDQRNRDIRLEHNPSFAIHILEQLLPLLQYYQEDQDLQLTASYAPTMEAQEEAYCSTSYFRELSYCLEHSVHHQALIKIGLREQSLLLLIDEAFGVAAATLRYQTTSNS
ncbi:hypothetical protein [Eisenibacter elegans]|uniref:hypothetical protein n=1 Tax=Eisenibacter elegans TaxID=997 RepID=UPI0012B60F39|nr:hypothetical protein [Eisenibacter elegans]